MSCFILLRIEWASWQCMQYLVLSLLDVSLSRISLFCYWFFVRTVFPRLGFSAVPATCLSQIFDLGVNWFAGQTKNTLPCHAVFCSYHTLTQKNDTAWPLHQQVHPAFSSQNCMKNKTLCWLATVATSCYKLLHVPSCFIADPVAAGNGLHCR